MFIISERGFVASKAGLPVKVLPLMQNRANLDRQTSGVSASASGSSQDWALVHGPIDSWSWQPSDSSPTNRKGLRPAKRGHSVQDTACKVRLDSPAAAAPRVKAISDDGLVPEEGVLHTSLPMVARGLLPLAPPERLHGGNGAIARSRARPAARHLRCPCRRHHYRARAGRRRPHRRPPCHTPSPP